MDEFDKLRITRNLPFLKEQLSDMIDLGPIMDELVSRHIWTYERRNDVAGSPEKCEKFIKCLIRSTPTAYREFIDILVKNNKKYIADRLQNTKIGDKDSTAESPASDERTKPTPEVKIVLKTESTMDEYMKKFENMIGKISDNNEKCSRKLEDKIDCLKLETKKGKEAISGLTN